MAAALPFVLSVGDLAAQGGETNPFLSLPQVISREGPQRLNVPGPSPSPASDLVLEPLILPASPEHSSPPGSSKEGGAGCSHRTQHLSLQVWGSA